MNETPLWCWPELCEACEVRRVPGPDVCGVSIDSRSMVPGELFIALSGDPGPRFHSSGSSGRNGHDFLPQAVAGGAAGVMISRAIDVNCPAIIVPDTLDGLWAIGAYARRRMSGRVAAITGSSGKTTARIWLGEILSRLGQSHASLGSLNNHWGVPLSLARMPREADFGLFEIGTNNAGEIAPLAKLVSPDVALVLNVLPAHLGRFESLAALTMEKLSISEGLDSGGTLVLPASLAVHGGQPGTRMLTFGMAGVDADADVLGSWQQIGDLSEVNVKVGDRSWTYHMTATGEHEIATSVAVIAMLYALNVDLSECTRYFSALKLPEGRGNPIKVGNVTIIDDSYNANPVSVRYALRALSAYEGQRVAILGEMLELGEAGPAMHQSLAADCHDLDGVITVGEGYKGWQHQLGERYWGHFNQCADIDLSTLSARLVPDAHLLVKGANKVFWVHEFVAKLRHAIDARQG
ncbi:MAG: UDP-N-acetylmuramoyl-tripeptide--D-alanyl-D-alanine ligase [Pseudomonadales bacterium]